MKRSTIVALALAVAATGSIPQAASAAEGGFVVSGGTIDAAHPNADVYVTDPTPATPSGRACLAAQRYVDLVNAGDYKGTAALFADDAVFLEPKRPSLKGRAQIDDFYLNFIGPMKPNIIPVHYQGDDTDCLVALSIRINVKGTQRYQLVSIDHFTMGAGDRFARMVAYSRPSSSF